MPALSLKGTKNKKTPKPIFKRVKWIQDFLTELKRCKAFISSTVVRDFLLIDDAKFLEMKKAFQKFIPVKIVTDLKLVEGKFEAELSPHKIELGREIPLYVKEAQKLYIELDNSINSTVNAMAVLSNALSKNAEIFKKLAIINTKIEVSFITILGYRICRTL